MPTTPTILHILSQRPGRTGSGVTLEALVRGCAACGYEQHVIVGTDTSDPEPTVAELPSDRIHPLVFGTEALEFALPGMSDVMPYKSTVFSSMTPVQLAAYKTAWKTHIQKVLQQVQPTLIHSHHIWIMSSMLKDLAANTPIVTHCHATGLRQMELCGPPLATQVAQGCSRNDHFVVLHQGHCEWLQKKLQISKDKITVAGAGFNENIFHSSPDDPTDNQFHLLYAGKYSASKGLPQLLDTVEILSKKYPSLQLTIAGSGSGPEADQLQHRMQAMSHVTLLGQVDQSTLAAAMRHSHVFVLPSYYEGLPLVLVEAAACGCRLVATNLTGVVQQLAPPLRDVLEVVELPTLETIDTPVEAEVPAFVERLAKAIERAMDQLPPNNNQVARNPVAPFTWTAVFQRIDQVWKQVLSENSTN